jgi:beta-phosphoglucomutase-like phosphatase (HAD superfamily)
MALLTLKQGVTDSNAVSHSRSKDPSPMSNADSRAAFGLDDTDAYGATTPEALAYHGPGAAALLAGQGKAVRPNLAAWPDEVARAQILTAAKDNHVLWDFDGVIADTEPVQWQSFRTLLARYDFTPTYDFHRPLMGHTEHEIWEMLFAQGAPRQNIDELIATRSRIYIDMAKRELPLSWVAHELMPAFHGLARKQYVISNGNPVNNQALLDHWGYAKYVEVVPLTGRSKGEHFIQHATDHPVPVVFEDSAKYAQIAKDSGAYVVGVMHGHSLVDELPAHVTLKI